MAQGWTRDVFRRWVGGKSIRHLKTLTLSPRFYNIRYRNFRVRNGWLAYIGSMQKWSLTPLQRQHSNWPRLVSVSRTQTSIHITTAFIVRKSFTVQIPIEKCLKNCPNETSAVNF
jgi:hypothetical protein